ncbi:MAG TPA: hypothetical protein VEU30_14480, partial [Thermoanaerobaculia bacterium]|nr:hypothetical protein [Thermoanaerobaculia bacterium]
MSTTFSRVSSRPAWPLAVIGWLLCTFAAGAAERGFPLITVYPAEVHKAGPQNFDVIQDRNGVLYVGNLHGLVIYDGAWWRLLELPDDQVALSLATDAGGRLAMGLVNDFGYLAHDASGSPMYRSLIEQLPEAQREVGDVREVCTIPLGGDGGFLYVAERSLVTWDGAKTAVAATFDAESAPRGCYSEGGQVLLRGPKGIQRFDPATRAITPTAVTDPVQALVRRADGKYVAVMRDKGVVLIDGDTVTPWAPAATEWLKGDVASGAARLHDGRIVITSRQRGVGIIDDTGAIEVLRSDAGLPDAVMVEPFVDSEGALWVAMEGPIVRIDVSSPVSVFDSRRGLRGGVSDVARYDGRLYAASSYGLHIIDERGMAQRVETLTDATWRIFPIDDELLVANAKGLWTIRGTAAPELIVNRNGEIYDLHRSKADPSRVWIAERYGISSIHRGEDGKWIYEPLIPGMPQYLSSVVEHDGVLYSGSVFGGIIRVD